MDHSLFTILAYQEEPIEIKVPFTYKIKNLFMKIPDKDLRINYILENILKKQFVELIPIVLYCCNGMKMLIPFTKEEFLSLKEPKILEIFDRIIKFKGVQNIVTDEESAKYILDRNILKSDKIPLSVIKIILGKVMKHENIELAELHLGIIDSDDVSLEEILSLINEDINYLTIVTDNLEKFKKFISWIYKESGLVVQVKMKNSNEVIGANIVIDLSKNRHKEYLNLKENSTVIIVNRNEKKEHELYIKRRDVHLYSKLEYCYNGQKANQNIIETALEKQIDSSSEILKNLDIEVALRYNTVIIDEKKGLN